MAKSAAIEAEQPRSRTDPNAIIGVDDVHKVFKGARNHRITALDGVSDTVARGEVLVLLGQSGSGKSTLLRSLNGLERVDSGRIEIDGRVVTDPKTDLNKLRAEVGMVFQNFNLFKHKTALDNVTMPLEVVRGLSRGDARERGTAMLRRVGIADWSGSYPSQLSGGQQQRVAIARSLAMSPKVMLFDEVTSALDPETVGGVLGLMEELAGEGMTMVVVTHEIGFAKRAADRIAFMDEGRIVERGDPRTFFDAPETARAKRFLDQIL